MIRRTICAKVQNVTLYKKWYGISVKLEDERIKNHIVSIQGDPGFLSPFKKGDLIWLSLEKAQV